MTDPRHAAVVAALQAHQSDDCHNYDGTSWTCGGCRATFADYEGLDGHVADAILQAIDAAAAEALPAADSPHMPAMNGTETTQTMRQSALPRSGTLRGRMVDVLRHAMLTDDGLEVALERSHQSVSAARHGLVQQGWIQPSTVDGEPVLRPTRAGNPAQVWTLTPAARLRLWLDR